MLKTPRKRAAVVTLALVCYLLGPVSEWHYLKTGLGRGDFHPDADSIILSFYRFVLGWLVLAPFLVAFIWFALRQYPGRVSLFDFNGARPHWSLGWSIVFAAPIFYELFFAIQSIYRLLPLDVLEATLTTYLLLCLRSSIIHRK